MPDIEKIVGIPPVYLEFLTDLWIFFSFFQENWRPFLFLNQKAVEKLFISITSQNGKFLRKKSSYRKI